MMSTKGCFTFFLLIWSSIHLYSQEDSLLIKYSTAVPNIEIQTTLKEKIINDLIDHSDLYEDPVSKAEAYYLFIKEYWRVDLDLVIALADKVHELGVESGVSDEDIFIRINYNRVLFKYRNNEFYAAIDAADSYVKMYTDEDVRLGKIYRLLGNSFTDLGDIENAINNFNQSEKILLKNDNKREISKTYMNLIRTCARFEDTEYFEVGLKTIEKVDSAMIDLLSNENLAIFYLNSGTLYDLTGQNLIAKESFESGLKMAKAEMDSILVIQFMGSLAALSNGSDQPKLAEDYINKALEYSSGEKSTEAMLMNNLGDTYQKTERREEALALYQRSVYYAMNKEVDRSEMNPLFSEMSKAFNKIDILEYLIDKGKCALGIYKNKNETKYLSDALETFVLADKLLDEIYFESREDLSKLSWRNRSTELYENAIETCFYLEDFEKIFYFMEKSSAILVLDNLTNNKAKELASLPEELRKKETNLILKIKDLQYDLSLPYLREGELDSIQNAFFEEKSNYLKLINSLEKEYPEYYQYRKKIEILDLESVKKSLDPNQVVLRYHLNERSGYVLRLTSNSVTLRELNIEPNFSNSVSQFCSSLTQPMKTKKEINQYKSEANRLYQVLFPFKNFETSIGDKELTIIPSYTLQNLPFEALIVDPDEREENYLINYSDIHYVLSLSFDNEMKSLKTTYNQNITTFFPVDFPHSNYPSLSASINESTLINSLFSGVSFQYEKASKAEFFKNYGQSKIVHISTHGGVDGETPWLSFYDQNMMINELYFEGLQSELVVLSACKTSVGKLRRGEGVMSMSRGFLKSGAKSVLSSLWEINEEAGLEITSSFYENLKCGMTKSESLRIAKLDYLKNHAGTSQASPYFWSAIVLTGANDSLNLSYLSRFQVMLIVGFILVLVIGTAWGFKKRKAYNKST